MAEIVAKYGAKEKELSARLLKKYGRPLPPSVPAHELRRVLLEFGLEDRELAGAVGQASATPPAAPTAAAVDRTSDESARRDPAVAGRQEGRQEGQGQGQRQGQAQGQGERQAERPPGGSELDFRSKFFDPLQVRTNNQESRCVFPAPLKYPPPSPYPPPEVLFYNERERGRKRRRTLPVLSALSE